MPQKSPKISRRQWNYWKGTILKLYLNDDLSINELAETMKHRYGFPASISQFETHLRKWKARKNVRIHEWKEVLPTIDDLVSRGVNYRVLVSGHLVSRNQVDRARRYCRGQSRSRTKKRVRPETGLHDASDNGSTVDVVIETQDPSGQWSRYTAPVNEDATLSRHPTHSDEALEPSIQGQLDENNEDQSGYTHDDSVNYQSFAVQPMDFSFVELEAQVTQPFVQYEPHADNTFLDLDSVTPLLHPTDPIPATLYLDNLPFNQFECSLALKRVKFTICPSPMQESRLSSGVQRLDILAAEAAKIMTKTNAMSFRQNFDRAEFKLQTLGSILPRIQRGNGSNSMAGPLQMTTEVELHRLLLYSSANGFMGLDGIPIETVFNFLGQNADVPSLLSRLFRDNPGHVEKSLAENLFRAAIESGDHNATRFFLQTGLVDVNKTVYIVHDEKYTPLERAAGLQHLKVIKELLRFNPEVNRSFLDRSNSYDPVEGVLGLLIMGNYPKDTTKRNHSTFPGEYLQVVELLIKAGARIHASSIYHALRKVARTTLAEKLLRGLPAVNHPEALSTVGQLHISNLQCIAEEFADEEATEAITKILSDCEQTGCKQCLSRFKDDVNRTIVAGAQQGSVRLVRSLFQHATSPTQILSAAINGGNPELIEFVLAQKPDIRRAPPESILTAPSRYISERLTGRGGTFTTPLAEAIDTGDAALIRRLENEGVLEHLNIRGSGYTSRYECAISAASKVGDIEYVQKLLPHHPGAIGSELGNALLNAVIYGQECVVRLLLDVGAEFGYLPSDIGSAMIEAYKLGHHAVLTNLMSTFPDLNLSLAAFYHMELSDKNLKWGDEFMNLFDMVLQSGLLTRETLTYCLATAVKRDDSAMLNRLLQSGADAMDESAINTAADGHTDMLRILLRHIPPTKMPIRTFGTSAVTKALEQHPSNIEALELLLACTAVDIKSFVDNWLGAKRSPLGLAIQRDAASGCSEFPLTTRLLDVGCNVDQIVHIDMHKIRHNWTAFLIAIKTKNKSMVQFFIDRGADINKEAIHGIKRTPLQAAAEQSSLDIVELLLQNGAHANDKPAMSHGGTALQCAAMSGNCNIAVTLLDHGASLYSPPSMFHGRWPIEGAAEYGRVDMIQFLWNATLSLGFPIELCCKAMALAEENGHMGCKDLIRKLAVEAGIMSLIDWSG
ncbi:ankyrin [Xylariaceae sp. FL0662B]|nr:ankyrin [Xylariaceae sp. FL0662B]